MAVAAPLPLREGDRRRLEALTRSTSVRAGLAQRARIVLLAADGVPNAEIARRTGSTRPTVLAWRSRYAAGGMDALGDKPRSGRPTEVDEIEVVATTLADDGRPPAHLGVTHWSSRLLAKELGVSYATVARIWRKWGIQPDRLDTFQFHIGPELDAEVDQFYRKPPGHSVLPQASRTPVPATGSQPAGRPAQQADPWLSLVEVSLGILVRQAIRRGSLASVHNLIEAIGALADGWAEPEESSAPAPGSTAPTVQDDRKVTSNTQQPCRPPSRTEVDLRRSQDQLSLRAEFHGSRSELAGQPDSQTP